MKTNHYIVHGGTLAYIRAYGRCAITRQPFAEGETICAILLPVLSDWPLPVWDDFAMGANAKAIAFISPANNPGVVPLSAITEATQCDGRSILFHPFTADKEQANETAFSKNV